MVYTFKAIDEEEWSQRRQGYSAKLFNPWRRHIPRDNFNAQKFGEYNARFRGAMLALFGNPPQSSSLADEAFDYFIEAQHLDGSTYLLTVYGGASGPAIGGSSRVEGSIEAAEALADYIDTATPADFETTIYDYDTDSTIRYGCKNGECYYEELRGDHR